MNAILIARVSTADLNKVKLPVSSSPLLEIKKQLLKFTPVRISFNKQ